MPKCSVKRIICSAAAAVITSAAALGVCFYNAPSDIHARASVYFTALDENNLLTNVTRSVSLLRQTVTDKDFIAQISAETGLSADELLRVIRVERMTDAEGADIIIADMDDPAEAPIILGTVMNRLEKGTDAPEFGVISYCDIDNTPRLPYINLSAAAGLLAALAVFLAYPYMGRGRVEYYHARKAEAESDRYYDAVYTQALLKSISERVNDLGTVTYSAPEGLEKSGHAAAFSALMDCCSSKPAVIAVSAAHKRDKDESIPFDTRFTAYLACAAAASGVRIIVVECDLKRPTLGKLFGRDNTYGISDIAAGNCAVWDGLITDARPGVDIITDSRSYPAPMAVFASGAFAKIIGFLSTQYELILLHTPKAWECEEWRIIRSCCSGIILAADGDNDPDGISCQGMMGENGGIVSVCRVSRSDDNEEKK